MAAPLPNKGIPPHTAAIPVLRSGTLLLFALCQCGFFSTTPAVAGRSNDERQTLLPYFDSRELSIANLLATPVNRAPAVATVITSEEIEAMGARSLLDVLRRVPGFGVGIASYPVFNSIEVRGVRTLFSEKILVMIDGHRMNQVGSGGATSFFEWFPLHSVQRVEIMRGPGSALHGSDALLATINLVTRAPGSNPPQLHAGLDSTGGHHLHASVGRAGDHRGWQGFADGLSTNGPDYMIAQDALGRSGRPLTWAESRTAGLALQWQNLALRTGAFHSEQGPYIGGNYILNQGSRWEQSTFWADLVFSGQIGGTFDCGARLYGDHHDIVPFWELFPAGTVPGFAEGVLGSPRSRNRTAGIESTLSRQVAEHRLTAGLQFEHREQFDVRHLTNFNPLTGAPLGPLQDVSDRFNFNRGATRALWAVFLQDVWNISEKLDLTAGLRHDVSSDFGSTTNPRLGLVWEAGPGTLLKLLYGTGFRAPVFYELYHRNNPSQIGNPDLRPETARTWELAIEHRLATGILLSANLYHNELDDIIVEGEKPSVNEPGMYQNGGSLRARGVEAGLNLQPFRSLQCQLSYAYQEVENEDSGRTVPDVPRQRANLGLDFSGLEPFLVHLDLLWTGARPRAAGAPRPTLGDSLLTDLSISSGQMFGPLGLRVSGKNIFATNHFDPSPAPGLVPGDYPSAARSFLFELTYTF